MPSVTSEYGRLIDCALLLLEKQMCSSDVPRSLANIFTEKLSYHSHVELPERALASRNEEFVIEFVLSSAPLTLCVRVLPRNSARM
jgi:hypothetical protein